jgi:hypothetical protein
MASKLVKLPEDLYRQAVEVADRKGITIGEALRFMSSPQSNQTELKVNLSESESTQTVSESSNQMLLGNTPFTPTHMRVNESLEQRVGDLEQETLTNRQLNIISIRQHARALLNQVGQKPVTAEEQLELFMSELAAIGVSQNVLETTQAVLDENGYKTLEVNPVAKPKALPAGGN